MAGPIPSLAFLPQELVGHIMSEHSLTNQDYKALRLVCRHLEPCARDHLFYTAVLSRRLTDHDSFFNIAASSHLAPCVHELAWREVASEEVMLRSDEGLSNEQVAELEAFLPAPAYRKGYYSAPGPRAVSVYRKLIDATSRELERGDMTPQRRLALSRMQEELQDAWVEAFKDLILPQRTQREGRHLNNQTPVYYTEKDLLWTFPTLNYPPVSSAVTLFYTAQARATMIAFQQRLEAGMRRLPNLSTLVTLPSRLPRDWEVRTRIMYYGHDYAAHRLVFETAREKFGAQVTKFVSRDAHTTSMATSNYNVLWDMPWLKSISLYFPDGCFGVSGRYFVNTFNHATSIEELELVCPRGSPEFRHRRNLLSKLFRSPLDPHVVTADQLADPAAPPAHPHPQMLTMPRLRAVAFENWAFPGKPFLNFYKRHAKTLQSIRLVDCRPAPRLVEELVLAATEKKDATGSVLASLTVVERGWSPQGPQLQELWKGKIDADAPGSVAAWPTAIDVILGAVRVFSWAGGRFSFEFYYPKVPTQLDDREEYEVIMDQPAMPLRLTEPLEEVDWDWDDDFAWDWEN